jgi:hypothetical protein
MVRLAGQLDGEEKTREPDEKDAGRPRPHIECGSDASCNGIEERASKSIEIPVDHEFPNRLFAFGDRKGNDERKHAERLKEDLSGRVIEESNQAIIEDRSGEKREYRDPGECRTTAGEVSCDKIGGDHCSSGENGSCNEHNRPGIAGRGIAETGQENESGNELIVECPELRGKRSLRVVRHHVERHRRGEMFEQIVCLPEVIPRVVPAEGNTTARLEPLDPPETDGHHNSNQREENRNMVEAFEEF